MPALQYHSLSPLQIIIVDSSHANSQALSAFLEHHGFRIDYAGPNANDALGVIKQQPIDLALVSRDLGKQEMAGFELAARIHAYSSSLRIVMILDTSDQDSIIRAFRSGARGVFCRTSSLDVLIKCIARVHEGQIWASTQELEFVLSALRMPLRLVNAAGDDLLSKREQEVVQWAGEGLSNREIASRLGLSENTIKNYLFRVFEKLGISSRVELILYAVTQLANVPGAGAGEAKPTLDTDESLFALCQEAAKHFTRPQRALAEMYNNGRGVARDPLTAYMWFCIAESLSGQVETAIEEAKVDLERELSLEEIERGRSRAHEWVDKHPSFSASAASVPISEPSRLALSREKSMLGVRVKRVPLNGDKPVER